MRLFGALLIATLAFLSGPVLACTCERPGTTSQEVQKSTHVFLGVVQSVRRVEPSPRIEYSWFESMIQDILSVLTGRKPTPQPVQFNPYVLVTFSVQERFKGAQSRVLTIRESGSSTSCGYEFKRGKTYVVYASSYLDKLQQHLTAGICSRTGLTSDPETGLAQLRDGI